MNGARTMHPVLRKTRYLLLEAGTLPEELMARNRRLMANAHVLRKRVVDRVFLALAFLEHPF